MWLDIRSSSSAAERQVLSFLALPAGISLADDAGMVAFGWLFGSYVLQAVGELLVEAGDLRRAEDHSPRDPLRCPGRPELVMRPQPR